MKQELKDIKGFEGLYAITKNGQVWSYPRKYGKYISKGRFIKSKINKRDGYVYIILTKPIKKQFSFKLHRLVALTYVSNPKNKREVNHINGIKTDNSVENLEWNTRQENATHATDILDRWSGEKNPMYILTDKEIKEIRKLASEKKYSQNQMGKMFGISQTQIFRIIHNQRRKICLG